MADIDRQYDRAHSALVRPLPGRQLVEPGRRDYAPGLDGVRLRRPALMAAAWLYIGILIGLHDMIPLMLWAVFSAVALLGGIVSILIKRPRVWIISLCLVTLGGALGSAVMTPPELPDEAEYFIEACITGIYSSDETRVVVDIDDVHLNGSLYKGGMRLTLRRPQLEGYPVTSDVPPECRIGADIALYGDVWLPQAKRGVYGFDYRAYLMRRGIYSCASGQLSGAVFTDDGHFNLGDVFYRMRSWLSDILNDRLGDAAPTARAIMFGDKSDMPSDLYDDFRTAGFSHLLATSGMHISLVIAILGFILGYAPIGLRTALITALIWIYCGLAGFSVSVMRAGIMGVIMLMTRLTGIRNDGPSSLGVAAIIILTLRPGAALDISFTLSFGAVLAIYALYPPLHGALAALGSKGLTSNGNKRPGRLTKWLGGALRYAADGIALAVCVNLCMLPLLASYFGSINLLGLLLAPIGILGGMGLLITGWLTALLGGVPVLGEICVWAAWLCHALITGVAGIAADAGWATLHMRAPNLIWLLATIPAWLHASYYRPLSGWGRLLCAGLALILTAAALLPPMPSDGLDYVMVDVGQGDAQLLTDGAECVIIDVGSEGSAMCDYIRGSGLRVKAIILSHLHEDHAGALSEIVQLTDINTVYLPYNAEDAADDVVLDMLTRLKADGLNIGRLSAGDVLTPLNGLSITALHPSDAPVFEEQNDYSLVLRAEYAGRSILMTGDLTQRGEDFDVERCDILKLAHHGSNSSSSQAFLAQANPALTLISVAQHNGYNLPGRYTMARLDYYGIDYLSTAERGDITVHITPDGDMSVRTYLN